MSIGIVTDSTCDLPAETIANYGIEVVPLHIQMGNESLTDGVNITKAEFYQRLPEYDPAPTTAVPGPEIFLDAFERLAEAGVQKILSIHISESLSAMVKSARMAAESFTRLPVTVLDSGQLSLGLGFLVESAARMAQERVALPAILDELRMLMKRTYTFAALDTLEYLRRSGRMHIALARFGELLRIKPLLHMHLGVPKAHRARTRSKAMQQLFRWLNDYGPYEHLAVLHAGVQERAEALRQQVRGYLPDVEIPIMQITPVLGAHLGLGALGFACVSKEE